METILPLVRHQQITLTDATLPVLVGPSSWQPPTGLPVGDAEVVEIRYRIDANRTPGSGGSGNNQLTLEVQDSSNNSEFYTREVVTVTVGTNIQTVSSVLRLEKFMNFVRVGVSSIDFEGTLDFKVDMILR